MFGELQLLLFAFIFPLAMSILSPYLLYQGLVAIPIVAVCFLIRYRVHQNGNAWNERTEELNPAIAVNPDLKQIHTPPAIFDVLPFSTVVGAIGFGTMTLLLIANLCKLFSSYTSDVGTTHIAEFLLVFSPSLFYYLR
jgi:hypothetical protein